MAFTVSFVEAASRLGMRPSELAALLAHGGLDFEVRDVAPGGRVTHGAVWLHDGDVEALRRRLASREGMIAELLVADRRLNLAVKRGRGRRPVRRG